MLLRLSNTPRDYAWGSVTALARLEGRVPSGAPEAEVWLGDHPGDPAELEDGTPLDRWVQEYGSRYGLPGRLPFLLKLLAAGSPLSIQTHPSLAEAKAGFAREDAAGIPLDAPHRNYRDANHKPEIIVALDERFEALSGFRPLARTRVLLDELGDAAAELREVLRDGDEEVALRGALAWVFSAAAEPAVARILGALAALPEDAHTDLLAMRRVAQVYPGDPGVVVALLLNRVELARGEALFTPAGVLHAYLDGLGVELMASSDNVLRGGLTPKHVDIDELLAIVDARPGEPHLLRPRVRVDDPDARVYEFDAPGIDDFALVRVVLDGGTAAVPLRGAAIVVGIAGTVTVADAEGECGLRPGHSCLVTPDAASVRLTGTGEVFLAQPGARRS